MTAERKTIPEADKELWEEYVYNGSMDARDELIIHYQPLVHATARNIGKRVGWKCPHVDLVSHGQAGLIKAVDNYNPEIGPFKKLASTLIFGAIIDELRSQDWLPRKYRMAQRELQKIGDTHGYLPTKELAEKVGWEESEVREVLVMANRAEVGPMNPSVGAIPGVDTHTDIVDVVLAAFDRLTFQKQVIIALRYFGKVPLTEIGLIVGSAVVSDLHSEAVLAIFDEVLESVS